MKPPRLFSHPLVPSLLLLAAGALAYSNSFAGVFVYDDLAWMVNNPRLQQLWPPWWAAGSSLRFVLFYTLALNYAISGLEPWSYHLVNLAIHLAAGLALYGVVRRTLMRIGYDASPATTTWLAFAAALLWIVHPLQTQSVTYVIQRGESLMGLCFLLTLYCLIRSTDAPRPERWYWAGWIAQMLGLGTKETMVFAPIALWLYDMLFLGKGGAFRPLWQRRRFYLGIAAPYLLGATFILLRHPPQFFQLFIGDSTQVNGLQYALNQAAVILYYLRLTVWPDPLCLDYAWRWTLDPLQLAGPVLLISGLLALGVWGLYRRRAWSYPVAFFFVALAPTSSFVPIRDLLVEHRMYLPLAAPLTLLVVGFYTAGSRLAPGLGLNARHTVAGLAAVLVLTAGAFTGLTLQRNHVYHDEYAIWWDVVVQHPHNPRGHNNLGNYLARKGHLNQAMAHYAEALRVDPTYPEAYNNLGGAHAALGDFEEAVAAYAQALLTKKNYPEAHNNLGLIKARQGKLHEAIEHYQQALNARADYAEALANMGVAWIALGDRQRATDYFTQALVYDPSLPEAHNNIGSILVAQNRLVEALDHYRQAIRHRPGYLDAHINLGIALLWLARYSESARTLAGALQLDPLSPKAHNYYGAALYHLGQVKKAADHHQQALTLHPGYADAHKNLARALQALGQLDGAATHYRAALRRQAQKPEWHFALADVLLQAGKPDSAALHLRQVIRLDPQHTNARRKLQELTARVQSQ